MLIVPLTRNQLVDLAAIMKSIPADAPGLNQCGFVNVNKWQLKEKALYGVWWSHRPPSCTFCGSSNAWTVSSEDEYLCGCCGKGAGSTATRETIDERWGGIDDDGESDDDAPVPSVENEYTAWAFYCFALEWLERLPSIVRETIPSGEDLCTTCRVAYDISTLFIVPGLPAPSHHAVKGASLFVALFSLGFNVPFPIFLLGSEEHVSAAEHVVWSDVQLISSQLRISTLDFFESTLVSSQCLQNVATTLAEYAIPSVLWHMDRDDGRPAYIASLRDSLKRSLSPEHTAAIVCCELAREYESTRNPLSPDSRDDRTKDWFYRWSVSISPRGLEDLIEMDALQLLDRRIPDLLVKMFAQSFKIPCLEMLEMVEASGLYRGKTYFMSLLQQCATQGLYMVLPICLRLSPFYSPWSSAYASLHGEDRLPLLAALQQISLAGGKDQQAPLYKLVQRIVRKHDAGTRLQCNFGVRCVDPDKQHMQGLYVLQHVTQSCAAFVCAKTGKKTLTFNALTKKVSLCSSGDPKERVVENVEVRFVGPVQITVEGIGAKKLIDCVRSGLDIAEWTSCASKFEAASIVRRRMKDTTCYPVWALSTIKEASSQLTKERVGSIAAAVHPSLSLQRVQHLILSLPRPSLIYGLSDATVLGLYSDLVALTERPSATQETQLPARSVAPIAIDKLLAGEPLRKRYRLDDSDYCMAALHRAWRALNGGDLSEDKGRVARRHRREEERKNASLFAKEWDSGS